jgi:hypothetical protein
MKKILYNKASHIWKFPIGLLMAGLIAFSPLIIGGIGAYFSELITGRECNEANCFWGVIPWFMLLTIPVGGVLGLIFIIITIYDFVVILIKR